MVTVVVVVAAGRGECGVRPRQPSAPRPGGGGCILPLPPALVLVVLLAVEAVVAQAPPGLGTRPPWSAGETFQSFGDFVAVLAGRAVTAGSSGPSRTGTLGAAAAAGRLHEWMNE